MGDQTEGEGQVKVISSMDRMLSLVTFFITAPAPHSPEPAPCAGFRSQQHLLGSAGDAAGAQAGEVVVGCMGFQSGHQAV